jgi:hypothetical protein
VRVYSGNQDCFPETLDIRASLSRNHSQATIRLDIRVLKFGILKMKYWSSIFNLYQLLLF